MVESNDIILMGHGGGGLLTKRLIEDLIVKALTNPTLDKLDDSACLDIPERYLAFTTDSFVIDPMFFPGGNIGSLAVCGTVNDLAMQGAEPRYLSLGLILEEGLALSDLKTIVGSLARTAEEAGVVVVTGDTKVIERRSDGSATAGIFINTSGIGVRREGVNVSVANARPGDRVIVTGTIGDHGLAVVCAREGLELKSLLKSDATPLWGMVSAALNASSGIRCLRDPTRGGLASALHDIAVSSSCGIRIEESALPLKEEARSACDLLGFDPLDLPNEGKAVIICADDETDAVLEAVRRTPEGAEAAVIGDVVKEPVGMVLLNTGAGGERIVDIPAGETLPRIC